MSVSFMLLECRELNIDFYKSDSWDFEEKLSWNFSQYVYVQVSQLGSDDKEQHSVGEGHVPSPHIQPQVPRGVVMVWTPAKDNCPCRPVILCRPLTGVAVAKCLSLNSCGPKISWTGVE